MTDPQNRVLILGSAPSAVTARSWPREPFTHVVAINNAWHIRPDWDILIHPEDFPTAKRPTHLKETQRIVSAEDYVPRQNQYGGFVYAGGTMAFTAGYWALSALRPAVLAYFGCDMVYSDTGQTHFYGNGTADPLRSDITLRSLEAKSARLAMFGAAQQCHMVRLSEGDSRLVFPSTSIADLQCPPLPKVDGMQAVLRAEAETGYFVESGRYWEVESQFDPEKVDELDRLWLSAYRAGVSESNAENAPAYAANSSQAQTIAI